MDRYNKVKNHLGDNNYPPSIIAHLVITNIGEIHYHQEKKTNGGREIEFSAESNHFEKKIESGNK